ncbi:NAD(P)-dependent oxidoreductase [Neobacillus sp. LXY-1]|uniref:NAD(P)-dependent oxidoreductase n=1 Tax=Neobacillus sp. LXY-1 TaxID=3379133 RepID=UPI003EE004D6
MNILLLGATGRVGSHILSYALHNKHHVTVLVRSPEKIQINNENLRILQGNVLHIDDLVQAMSGVDVVFSALNTDGTSTLSESIQLIVQAMESAAIKRIITVGTAGILQSRITPNILRYQSSESKRKSTRAAEEHQKVFEVLKQSTLDWTIVCPTYLPDGQALGTYRVERDYLPEGGSEISVQDTAWFTYSQMNSHSFIKTRVGIAY